MLTIVSEKSKKQPNWEDIRLRRLAIQTVAQLPESPDEALRVLEYCHKIIVDFLSGEEDLGIAPQS